VKDQWKQKDKHQHQERLSQAQVGLNRIIQPFASAPTPKSPKDRKRAPKRNDLDYTLELLEDQTDDPSVVRLLNNADVTDTNQHHVGGGSRSSVGLIEGIGHDQFRVLYREMLSIRKEMQSLKDEFKRDLIQIRSQFDVDCLNNRQQTLACSQQPRSSSNQQPQPTSIPNHSSATTAAIPVTNVKKHKMLAYVPEIKGKKRKSNKTENTYTPPTVEWQMQFTPENSAVVDKRPAVLCENPKTLYVVWQEYMYGVNGSKPAKDFTVSERGAIKSKYCRRKILWDQIVALMRSKYLYTANQAIEKIYNVYGIHTPISKITDNIRADKNNGGHPGLME
jgi:hypothetical protein